MKYFKCQESSCYLDCRLTVRNYKKSELPKKCVVDGLPITWKEIEE